jgi:hypothetical protein
MLGHSYVECQGVAAAPGAIVAGWTGRNDCNGGRSWWAHFEFTRINIELTILPKKIEEQLIRARSASVDEGLVSGSRGKSQAGFSVGRRSRRWFEPQERAGVGQHVQ